MRQFKGHTLVALLALLLVAACALPSSQAVSPPAQILFVCEHGNVKSLMAASYFNRSAREQRLPFIAIARGTAPNATSVPPGIVNGLRADGIDVSAFHPAIVTGSDVASAQRVITIGVPLPASAQIAGVSPEHWDDIPPASVDFQASSKSLKAHVEQLIMQLNVLATR